MNPHERLTVSQAAERLGLSPQRVRELCVSGIIKAEKFGRDYAIDPRKLDAAKDRPKPGRPRKEKEK